MKSLKLSSIPAHRNHITLGSTQKRRHSPGSLTIKRMHSRIRPRGSQSTTQNKECRKTITSSFSVSTRIFLKPSRPTIRKRGNRSHQEAEGTGLSIRVPATETHGTPESGDRPRSDLAGRWGRAGGSGCKACELGPHRTDLAVPTWGVWEAQRATQRHWGPEGWGPSFSSRRR